MKTILVTGGAGFIGSHVAAGFAARGDCRVVVCDQFGNGEKWRNLAKHPVQEIIGPSDLFAWMEEHREQLEAIYHMGAIASTVETNVDLMLEANFSLSARLWRWCAKHQKRFIYASSATTYGNGVHGFEDRSDLDYLRRLKPMTGSGWIKQVFDQFVAGQIASGEPQPAQWAGMKFFNVYGPNEYHKESQKSVVCKLFPFARAGQAVKLYKSFHPDYPDGGQVRDFVHVADCAKVMLWLYDTPHVSGILNVGTGKARSFADLAKAIFAALGKDPHITYIDMPAELTYRYQYHTQANLDRLRAAGYTEAFIGLEEGVKDYVQNYLMKEDVYF